MAERYRPITQYDEKFEDKTIEQSEENRKDMNIPKRSTEDLSLMPPEERKMLLESDLAYADPESYVRNKEAELTTDALEGKFAGGNLLGASVQPVIYDVKDVMHYDQDGSIAASLGLPRGLRKNVNSLLKGITTIQIERDKGKNLGASLKIEEISQRAKDQGRALEEDEIEEIQELEADVQSTLENIAENEESVKENERIIGEYWLNQLDEDKNQGGGFFGSNSLMEVADSLGGSYSEIGAMATTWTAAFAAKAAWTSAAGAAATYTAGTAVTGWMGPQALLGIAAAVGAFGVAAYAQVYSRSSESYAEMYGAYEGEVIEEVNHFKLMNEGREPSEEELAEIEQNAKGGIKDVYEQNMALMAGDALEIGLAFIPWGKALTALGAGGASALMATRAGKFAIGAGGVGVGLAGEGFEEGYQHLVQSNYNDDDYGKEGFWRAVGNSLGTYGESVKGVGNHAISGILDYRVVGERSASSAFRAAANSGMALGGVMGGTHAALGQAKQRIHDRYNLAKHGEDAQLIADQFSPEAIEDRLLKEEQDISRFGWLFNKSKEGKGNFLNSAGIRKLASAYNNIKRINPEILEGVDENAFFQTLNDAETYSEILSDEKFSDMSEETGQNAFIQLMRFSEASKDQRSKLAESEIGLSNEIDSIPEAALAGFSDEQKESARQAMVLKSKLGVVNSLLKGTQSVEWINENQTQLNNTVNRKSKENFKKLKVELQAQYNDLINESGLAKKDIKKLGKKNTGVQGAFHQTLVHSNSAKLADDLTVDMLMSPSGKALENNPAVRDFGNHMQEARKNAKTKQEDDKKEQTKVNIPGGSNDLKSGEEAYKGGVKGKYREIDGKQYFVPDESENLTDEEIIAGKVEGPQKIDNTEDLEVKKTREDAEIEIEKEVKKSAENKKKEEETEEESPSTPGPQLELNFDEDGNPIGSPESMPTVPTLEDVENEQEVVNEEANDGLDVTEETDPIDNNANKPIEITADPEGIMPKLLIKGKEFAQFLLSRLSDVFIDNSVNVRIELNRKAFKDLNTNAEELNTLANKLKEGDTNLTERESSLLSALKKDRGGVGSLLYIRPNKNANSNFLVPNKGSNIDLKISNYIKTLLQVVSNDAKDIRSYAVLNNPIYKYNNTDQTLSVQSLFTGDNPIILGVSDGRSIMRGKNSVKALRRGSAGRLYAVVNGVTVKLNNRNINNAEATLLYDLISAKLQGLGGEIYKDSGLTTSEYINMLVVTYSKAKAAQLGNPNHNLQIKNNEVIFGDPALKQSLNKQNIAENKDAFLEWAEENKKRRIQGRALGGKMFEQLKLTNKEKITFLGQEYTSDSIYDEMLYAGEDASNHPISTDIEIINGSPITIKNISINPVIETIEKKPESTTISAPAGNDNNEIITDSEEDTPDSGGGAIPPVDSPGGISLFMDTSIDPKASTGERVNRKEAKEWLLRILGKNVPVEFSPVFIRMANMDGFSYGRFHDAMITLSLKGPKGVEYHEGYHAIEELFLEDKEIQELLKESKRNYPAASQSALLKLEVKYPGISRNTAERIYYSEIRAEDYRMYETAGATAGIGEKTLRWFKMLKGLFTYYFTDKMTADLLFYRISSGFYADKGPRPDKIAEWKGDNKIEALDSELKNAIPQKNIENTAKFLINQFIGQPNVVEKDKDGKEQTIGGLGGYINVKNVSDFSRLVNNDAIVRGYIEGVKNAISISDNFLEVDKTAYIKSLDSVIDQLVDTTNAQKALLGKARAEYQSAHILVKENPENRFEDINEGIAFLKKARKKFKLDELAAQPTIIKEIKKQLMALNLESKEESKTQNKDVFAATKHTFESSNRDNANTNTKVLLSFLAKLQYDDQGNVAPVRDPYTGLPIMANFGNVWNPLESELANIVHYSKKGEDGQIEHVFIEEQMLKKIKELALKDPTFNQVLVIFESLNKNEQTQFLQAMSKGSNNFVQSQKSVTTKKTYIDGIEETETNIYWRFFNPSKNSKKYRILEKWVENLKDTVLYGQNTSKEARIAKAKEILKTWDNVFFDVDNVLVEKEGNTYLNSKKLATRISNSLKEIGINTSPNAILNLLNSENTLQKNKNILKSIGTLFRASNKEFSAKKISEGEGDFNYENDNPINGEKKITLQLAEEAAVFEKDYGQSNIISATGSSYWDFGLNHYLKKKISQFKSNAGFYVDELKTSVFHNDSLLLNYLATEEAEIERRIFSGFKIKGSKKGYDYKDIDPAQERSLRINLALNDIFIPMTPADKGSWNLISGFEAITIGDLKEGFSYNSETETYVIPNKIRQYFTNYAITELKRMHQTRIALFGENALPNEKLVQHYHYRKLNKDGTPNRKTANALKSQIFPSFNDKEVLKEMEVLQADGSLIVTNTLAENIVFKRVIDSALNNVIKTEINGAIKSEALNLSPGSNKLISSVNDVDVSKINAVIKLLDTKTPEGNVISGPELYDTAMRMLMTKYALSGTIANIETLKVFSGDPAFYKSMPDLTKRIPGIIAPGKDLMLSGADDVFYRAAVLQDVKNTKGRALREEYTKNLKDEGFTDEEIDSMLVPYDNYSVTDAQGWITLDRWRFLNEKLGRFDSESKEHVAAFNRLKDGAATKEDMKLIQAMPMKGMHFELRQEGNLQVPTYIKYSQAVLIPQFTKGRELNSLLEAMTEQKIDEVIVDEGVKAGGLSPINIMGTTAGSILPSGEIAFNVMNLRNEYWKLQQDLSPHEEGSEALEGSQVKKNMLANIFQEDLYGSITGHELIRQMHSVDRQLSDLGRKELQEDFGVEVKNGEYTITDWKKIQKRLVEEFTTGSNKKKATKKLLASLALNSSENPTGFAIPLDQNSFRNQINSAIGSFITKKTVKLKMPGGTYVQMSPFGAQRTARYSSLSEEQRNEIDKRINKDALQPARKGKNKTNRVQILLPSWFKDLVPGNESMSAAEIGNYIADKRLLNGIAYRIPNQGMSSIDAFEVVGFLPKSMADTVIAYDELTAKTGSDFDIDKMFIMLPAYGVRKKDNSAYYIDPKHYLKEDGTFKEVDGREVSDYRKRQVLRNKKLELYATVIAHPKAFSQVIAPLDSITHKYNATKKRYLQAKSEIKLESPSDFEKLQSLLDNIDDKKSIENIENFIKAADEVLSITTDLEFFSPSYQFEIKKTFVGGKFGVAQTARHLVDHSISQWNSDINGKPYSLSTNIGMGNTYADEYGYTFSSLAGITGEVGNLISTTLSGRLNAYVDIAKDPYIFYLNNNSITANTVFLLDRLGVDPTWTDFFMSQPILEKYVDEKRRYDSDGRAKLEDENGNVLNPFEAAAYSLGISRDDYRSLKKGFPISTEIPLQSLLDNLDSTKSKDSATYIEIQLSVLIKYELLDEYSSELNKAVTASKADTEGASGGIYDVLVSNNLKEELRNSDFLEGFEDRFKDTMLGKYDENSIQFMDAVLGDKFAVTSAAFQDMFRRIKSETGLDVYKNADTLRKITEHLHAIHMANQMGKARNVKGDPFYDSNTVYRLFYGEDSLAKRLKEYQKPDSSIANNPLIEYLTAQTGTEEKDADFIKATRTAEQDAADLNSLIDAWQELLMHPDIDVRAFAEDLSVYSFITTANTSTVFGFSELVPLDFENKLFDRIKDRISSVLPQKDLSLPNYFTEQDLIRLVKNNMEFPGLAQPVHHINAKTRRGGSSDIKKIKGVPTEIVNNIPKYGFYSHDSKLRVPGGDGAFKKFTLLKNSKGNNVLYILTGIFQYEYRDKKTGEPKVSFAPVYTYEQSLGYTRGAHKIVELKGEFSAVPENVSYIGNTIVDNNFAAKQAADFISLSIESYQTEMYERRFKYQPTVDLSREWKGDLEKRPVYSEAGVNTMRTSDALKNEHFGNPFSEAGYSGTIKVRSIPAAVQMYKDWLLRNAITESDLVEGSVKDLDKYNAQREWILNQIKEDKLDGQKLLYAGKLAARGQGSHANALAEVVEEIMHGGMPVEVEESTVPIVDDKAVVTTVKGGTVTTVKNAFTDKQSDSFIGKIEHLLTTEQNRESNKRNESKQVAIVYGPMEYRYPMGGGREAVHTKKAIPQWMQALSRKVEEKLGKPEGYYNHVLINRYGDDVGIGTHTDDESLYINEQTGEVGSVAIYSIGHTKNKHIIGGVSFQATHNSLAEMSTGELSHSVGKAKGTRYSINFRHIPPYKFEAAPTPTQQTSEVKKIEEKDLSFKKGKLETFTLATGTEVKGTSIIIENQPNVDLFVYKNEKATWVIVDNKGKREFPLTRFSSTKNEILEALHSDIIKHSKKDFSRKTLESIGFNFEVREELGGQSTANPITAAITKVKLEEIKANKNFIKGKTKEGGFVDIGSGDEYESYYNTKTNKEYERTSNFIAEGESITDIVKEKRKEGESVKDYNKRISKLKPTGINPKTKKPYTKEEWDKVIEQRTLVESSFVIGTKIDVFVRDFFDNALQKDENGNIIYSAYDATGGDVAALRLFLSQLEQLKKRFEKTGETVEANDIILYDDELGIAGTVDLLTYDKNGVFRIYDLKTMRGNQLTDKYGDIAKYDSKKFGKSNREKHTDQLSVYRIMLNNTHGVLSPSLEIVHMVIDYQSGDESSKKIDLLPENTILTVKNEVKGKINGKEVTAKLNSGSQGTIVGANTVFMDRPDSGSETNNSADPLDADDNYFGNYGQLEDTFMGQAERQSRLAEDAQNITGIHSGFTLSSQVETDLINNKGWAQEEVDEFNLYIAANRERFRNETIAFIAAVRLQEYLEQNAEDIKEGEKMATKADKMLDRYLMNWLEEYDVTLKATSLQAIKERYGMDAIAITDVVNRVIAFSNDDLNAYTFPEEFSHMLIELLGSNNEIVKPLLDNIEGWGKYNSIFNLYRKQKAYQNPDGSPNVSKIKNEAAGKILSEAIVMQNTNRSKPKGKFLKLAYELLEKIKEFFGAGETKSVNGIANKIARQVLFENKEWANKYIERKEKRVFNKEKNIESQESQETLRVIRNVVTRLGGKLTNQFKVGANGSMFKSGTTSASNLDFTVPQLFKKPNIWTEKSAELVKTFIEDKNTARLTLDEAINSIDSQSKGDKILIEILKPYLKGKSIYYQDGWHFKLDHPSLKGGKYGATVSSNGDILIFNEGNFDLHTIIHEALHTLVHTKINRTSRFEFDEDFAEEIQRLYDLVKQDSSLVERYSYAFTNLDEFVSEAFGNGSFRQELAYIEDTLSPYSSNIFKSFIDAIRNFLKSKHDFEISNSALESIFNAVDHSIQKASAIEKTEIETRTLEWVLKDLKAALPNFTLSQIVEIDNNSYRVDGVISDINSVKEAFLEKEGTNAERINKLSKFEKDNAVAVSFNFKPDNEVANLSYGTWDKAFDSQIYKGTSELNRFAGVPIESGLETTSVEAFYASLDLKRIKVKAEGIIKKYGTGTGKPIRSYKEKFYVKKDTGTMAINGNNAIKFVNGVNDKYFNGDKVVKIITDNSFKRRVITVPAAFNGGQIDLFDSDDSTNPQRNCK